jgi:septin family protein
MKTLLMMAEADSPDLSLIYFILFVLVLFWAVTIAVSLGRLVKESKKQTELLHRIAKEPTDEEKMMELIREGERAREVERRIQETEAQFVREREETKREKEEHARQLEAAERDAAWRKAQEESQKIE